MERGIPVRTLNWRCELHLLEQVAVKVDGMSMLNMLDKESEFEVRYIESGKECEVICVIGWLMNERVSVCARACV